METLLNEIEAARFLKLSRSFLRQSRVRGDGPAFIKAGRAVRYRVSDLEAWITRRTRQNTLLRRAEGL